MKLALSLALRSKIYWFLMNDDVNFVMGQIRNIFVFGGLDGAGFEWYMVVRGLEILV